jgi:hypothetical protein
MALLVVVSVGTVGVQAGPATAEATPPPAPTGVAATWDSESERAQIVFDAESGLGSVTASQAAWASTVARKHGDRGLFVNASATPGFVRWGQDNVPQGHTHASARLWVNVRAWAPGESVDVITISNAQSAKNFDLFIGADSGRFQWDIHHSTSDETNFQVERNRWYLIEVQLEFEGTRHTADVRIDGEPQGTLASNGRSTTIRSVTVGANTAKTHTQGYDDLAVRVGDAPLGWLDGPQGAGDSSVELTWNAVFDAGAGLREYQIWRNDRWYDWVPAGVTRYVDRQPIADARYELRSVDWDKNKSNWSNRVRPR